MKKNTERGGYMSSCIPLLQHHSITVFFSLTTPEVALSFDQISKLHICHQDKSKFPVGKFEFAGNFCPQNFTLFSRSYCCTTVRPLLANVPSQVLLCRNHRLLVFFFPSLFYDFDEVSMNHLCSPLLVAVFPLASECVRTLRVLFHSRRHEKVNLVLLFISHSWLWPRPRVVFSLRLIAFSRNGAQRTQPAVCVLSWVEHDLHSYWISLSVSSVALQSLVEVIQSLFFLPIKHKLYT